MPIQIWTHDRSPELRLAGADRLAAGISGGVAGLARGFEKRQEERKRLAQAGKAADAFYKALPADALPIPAEDWALLSPVDKASAMQGIIGAQHYERGVADTKRLLAAVAMEREQQANLALQPEFFAEAARLAAPQPTEGPATETGELPAPLHGLRGLQLRATAAARSGYRLPDSAIDDVLRTADEEADLTVRPPTTSELPGGMISYGFPGTKVRGVYPDTSKALEMEYLTGPSGQQIPVLRAPGSKTAQFPPQQKGEITKDSIHRRLTATYQSQLQHGTTRAAAAETLKKLEALERGEELPAEGTGAAPMELPRTAAGKIEPGKLTKGARYNSPQGVVTWNGEKFVKE